MWIRKTEEELKSERRKRILLYCLSIMLLVFLVQLKDGIVFSLTMTLFVGLPTGLICAVVGDKIYRRAYLSGPTGGPKFLAYPTTICDRCNKIKNTDIIKECPCGGEFVNEKDMKCV